jgi:glycosyltransferase involved in cell wall biosynthesis
MIVEGISQMVGKRQRVLVLYPFSQSYLPEFNAFNDFDTLDTLNVTDSDDIITKIGGDSKIVKPEKFILPLGNLLTYKFGFLRNIGEILRLASPAAVVTFELYSSLSFQVCMLKHRYRYRHVVICYDTIPARDALWGIFPPTRYFSRKVMEEADTIIALSNRIREAILASGASASKVTMTYPGVYSHAKRGSGPKASNDSTFSLLFLGRLRDNKGIRTLLSAFQMLTKEGYSNMRLVIAGDGPLAELVSSAARSNGRISFVGNVYGEDKWKLFSNADVFLYPSEDHISIARRKRWEEQTAAAVREAMASGLPVIVSDSGSLPEIVGRQEQVFRQGNILELHDRILEFYQSPSKMAELAEWNQKRSAEKFDMKTYSRRLEDIINGAGARHF